MGALSITTPADAESSKQQQQQHEAHAGDGPADVPKKRSSMEELPTELDFQGDVDVDNELPTADDLAQAADLAVFDSKGESRPFKSLYETSDAATPRQLIIFVRHFFCGNCQEYLRTLSSSVTPDTLKSLPTPTSITVIGCGKPELIDMYAETTNCPFPIYADPTRKLYEHLRMGRTLDLGKKTPEYMQSSLFGAALLSIYQAVRSGSGALRGGDFKQVGGEFLFENAAPVWCHRMRNTRDHIEVPELRLVLGLDGSRPPLRKTWSSGIKELGKLSRTRSNSWGRPRGKSVGKEKAERSDSAEIERKGLLDEDDKPHATSAGGT